VGKNVYKVDLNSDLGESFGSYDLKIDKHIIPLITSANIACGFHASDPMVMMKSVALAQKVGTDIGAHPGFPDLVGFGRRNMVVSFAEAKADVLYQIGALSAFCQAGGIRLQHVKPHGGLYNMSAKDYQLALAICEAVKEFDKDLILLGLSGSEHIKAAKDCGLKVAHEVFADRGYEEDGSLVARSKEGAFIHDETEAVVRVIRMVKEGKVTAVTGKDIDIQADSICVHGDGEKALLFVSRIRTALEAEGVKVCSLKEVIE